MTLNEKQQRAIAELRARLASSPSSFGTVESVDQRTRRPDPAHLPEDVTVRIEIAPPSAQAHPLLSDTGALRTPERVPIYFYTLRDQVESDIANTHVIFFIHGGGNVVGHPTDPPFIAFYARILRACASHSGTRRYVLIAPSYRLATVPENAFPAALQDLVSAYDYVLSQGYNPSNIVIGGDSAGGSHALVLTHLVIQADRAPPREVVCIAPGTIRGTDHLSELAKANASTDILDLPQLEALVGRYVGDAGVALKDPLVSAAYIPFTSSWPRTLILVGTGDVLIDGSRELAKRLSALKLGVELVEYDGRPHGWWTMPQLFPEEFEDAVKRIAKFIF